MYRLWVILLVVAIAIPSMAVERKRLSEVDQEAFNEQSRVMMAASYNEVGAAWLIPQELWKLHLLNRPLAAPQIMKIVSPYFILGVAQVDMSPFNSGSFYPEDSLTMNLTVAYRDSSGAEFVMESVIVPDADFQSVLDILRPTMQKKLGYLSNGIHFLVFPDVDESGERIVDPYIPGALEFWMETRSGKEMYGEIELPMDALFVPRICPNGKPAHVSWKYCPWTGEKLPE